MSRGMQRIEFIGNLGRDPESRYTTTGKQVVSFSVAVNEKYGENESTEWFRCTAWEKLGEICHKYLKKGSSVYLAGKIKTTKYTDRDGAERSGWEVVVREVTLLASKHENGDAQAADPVPQQAPANEAFENDDSIPF